MLGSINSNTATSIVEEMQNNNFEAKAIKKAEAKLKKYEDEVSISNKRISGLGQLKTLLEDLSSKVDDFTFNQFSKNGAFDAKKVIASKELTENYANIKIKPGTINQDISLEITKMAKGHILESYNSYKPGDKMKTVPQGQWNNCGENKITFTVHDNGVKSGEFDEKDVNVVGTETGQFKIGKFSIGNSREIEIKDGDTLKTIVNKINWATKADGEEGNPHVIAEVVKDKKNKYFIWIRSDAKHHGVQNEFAINGNNKSEFTSYNETIDVSFDADTTVGSFIANLKQNAKKADIEVTYTENGKILLKSLLTGKGNEIQIAGYMHVDSSGSTSCNHIHLDQIQEANDVTIEVDGIKITSKTNTIETEDLKIELFGEPKKPKTFNLKVANDTEGLYEKFEGLAKSYNELSLFIAQNSLKVHDRETYSKSTIKAILSTYYDTLSWLNNQLVNYFNQFNQGSGYVKEGEISDLGIGIISKEITPPAENIEGVEQEYMPVQYNELVIDKKKLQNALEEKFDTFKEILSYQFDTTNTEFHLINNHQNVNFEAQGVKNLEYTVDYSKVKYMSNISKQANADTKVNDALSDTSYFIINDVKIAVDKETTYTSLVDEINKHSSITKIIADLLDASNTIVSTQNPEAGSKFKIALSLYYKTEEERKEAEEGQGTLKKQDDLRSKLTLVDLDNVVLKGIFNQDDTSLDDDTEDTILDDKIPQIKFFDTSTVVEVKANLQNFESKKIPTYLKLIDPKKYEEGGYYQNSTKIRYIRI